MFSRNTTIPAHAYCIERTLLWTSTTKIEYLPLASKILCSLRVHSKVSVRTLSRGSCWTESKLILKRNSPRRIAYFKYNMNSVQKSRLENHKRPFGRRNNHRPARRTHERWNLYDSINVVQYRIRVDVVRRNRCRSFWFISSSEPVIILYGHFSRCVI